MDAEAAILDIISDHWRIIGPSPPSLPAIMRECLRLAVEYVESRKK